MLSVAEARQRIVEAARPMPPEQIALADAFGRVLAEDLCARRTQPPLPVSAMDGYAVRAADVATLPARLNVIGAVPAGQAYAGKVGPGQAVRIFTGAPVPHGADTIVIQENTRPTDGGVEVVDGEAPVGRFIRPAGLDFRQGDTLLPGGRVLTARDIGLVAGMDIPWLKVRRRPRVALLATGDEIVMPGEPIGANQIVSSNVPALMAFVAACGGSPIDLGIAPDEDDGLRMMAAGAEGADILITTGGASVGDHDLVQRVLGDVGLEVDFWKIAMRPGKPLIFGRIGRTLLLGLPGNPVSSLVCATLFLRPLLGAMLATHDLDPPSATATLTDDLPANDEREDYLRARLVRAQDGTLCVTAFDRKMQDSSVFSGMAAADALLVRPPHAPAAKAGETVSVIPLAGSIYSI